ncbi:MAG: tautomerase family protein [Chloroflexi bacterium]|nr:tautomerase family protein [Chloroflexota bacterium]
MPEIILELAEGRTVDQKRQIVKEFTETMVRVCGVDPEAVVVIIHEIPRTDKAKGGRLFIDR